MAVLRSSAVECVTHNLGAPGSSLTESSEFFFFFFPRECPLARHFRDLPSTVNTQETHRYVICCLDITGIMLKAS